MTSGLSWLSTGMVCRSVLVMVVAYILAHFGPLRCEDFSRVRHCLKQRQLAYAFGRTVCVPLRLFVIQRRVHGKLAVDDLPRHTHTSRRDTA